MYALSLTAIAEQIVVGAACDDQPCADIEQLNAIWRAVRHAIFKLEQQKFLKCSTEDTPQLDAAILGLREIATAVNESKQNRLREGLHRGAL